LWSLHCVFAVVNFTYLFTALYLGGFGVADNIIQHKRSSVAGKVPLPSDLEVGQLAVNLADGIIHSKDEDGNIIVAGQAVVPLLLSQKVFTETVLGTAKSTFDLSAKVEADGVSIENLTVTLNGIEQQNDEWAFTYDPTTKLLTFSWDIPIDWVVQVTITDIIGD
jgi:hypothetical protein